MWVGIQDQVIFCMTKIGDPEYLTSKIPFDAFLSLAESLKRQEASVLLNNTQSRYMSSNACQSEDSLKLYTKYEKGLLKQIEGDRVPKKEIEDSWERLSQVKKV